MSADACIAFIGLRFEIFPESVEELLENGNDPRIQAASTQKLDVLWENFGGSDERYLLFIGKKLTILGPENELDASLTMDRLSEIFTSVQKRLSEAGFQEYPRFFLQWLEDA